MFQGTAILVFVLAVVIVLVGALVLYVGSLVKSAYELRIEMRHDLDEGLKQIDEEIDKRTRWLRQEIAEELAKAKSELGLDSDERLQQFQARISDTLARQDQHLREQITTQIKSQEEIRIRLKSLENKLNIPTQAHPSA